MELNHWWIRDLFRYIAASLYSLTIISYIVISCFSTLFGIGDLQWVEWDSLSESIVKYLWEERNFEYKEYNGIKRNKGKANNQGNNLLAKITWNKVSKDNTDQSLQDGEEIVEWTWNTSEFTWWNKFNIDKIIADLHLQKEKRVAVVAKELWIDRKNEKLTYARMAWIYTEYNWSLEQNQQIRNYLIANAQEIYMDKHWWKEWDNLPLVAKKEQVKMNAKEITWQVTYNDVTLKVIAPVESFPEWTILKIKTLWDNDSTTTFDITLKEVILMTQVDKVELNAPMASFDVSFYAPDDTEFANELQPATWKYVSVVFDYAKSNEFKTPEDDWFLAIYHMEENDETSIANLVKTEDSKEKTKSDSIGIYANTLSVYILTIVSDLEEEIPENNKTITIDTSTWWFIKADDNIILSSTWSDSNYITWKILSKDDTITLPNIETTWFNFSWWYNWNTFLWKAWDSFKLKDNTEESTWDNVSNNNYSIYACLYTDQFSWNICTFDDNQNPVSDQECVLWEDEEVIVKTDAYIPSEEDIKKYGQELFDAYNWAISNWITTIDDINKAKLNTKITRGELAKMMVMFMSWVLQKEPIITGSVNYKDVDAKKLWDLEWYIQLAYQYQIMGINADWTPIEKFNPKKPVTRWEFATVLSRILYSNTYNQNWVKYYEKHIEALNKANILSDTNPNLTEWRWWIMTMLYRAKDIPQTLK